MTVMTTQERSEIAEALADLMGRDDPLTELRAWGIEELLTEDPEAALAPLFRARGRLGRGEVALETLLGPARLLPLADAPDTTVVLRAGEAALSPHVVAGEVDGVVVGAERALVVRLLAEELCGLAEGLLEQAKDHTSVRTQFGAPLSALQVVRHKLVDVHVEIAAAAALLDVAWAQPASGLAADTAKVWAGQAFRQAAVHGAQVCGGIGFSEEFGMYRAIRRGHLLDGLLIGATTGTAAVGRQLAALGTAPRRPLLATASEEIAP